LSAELLWIIVYGNGATFSNLDGAWVEAPGWNCQVVLFRDPLLGWTQRHGAKGGSQCDFFRITADGIIVGMETAGMIGMAISELGIAGPETELPRLIYEVVHEMGIFKQGKMLTSAEWSDILKRAMALRDKLRRSE
jgi:hypothetical protein